MIATLIILVALLVPSYEQDEEPVPISPCPDVFQYDPSPSVQIPTQKRWYGVIKLATRVTIQSLTLHIILDSKADLIGNWLGETTSHNNIDFKIDNTSIVIKPGAPATIPFFVQYGPLVPAPKIKIIRMNNKEICNANKPQPAVEGLDESFGQQAESPAPRIPIPPLAIMMQSWPIQYDRVIPRPSTNLLSSDSNPIRDGPSQFNTVPYPERPIKRYPVTQNPCQSATETLHVFQSPNTDDDYFDGGPATVNIPCNSGQTNPNRYSSQHQCGVVALNSIPLVIKGTPTKEGQWPWQVALYHSKGLNNEYLCGGTLVSLQHVITAAHCVSSVSTGIVQVDSPNRLSVFLGKHNLITSVNGVQFRFVSKVIVNPDYNKAPSSTGHTTYSRDVAILELQEPVVYTEVVRPACLWPEEYVDIQHVIGRSGSVVGWGRDASGQGTEELKLAVMPVVDELTCIKSHEFFRRFASPYTYCAGSRGGPLPCLGDSGGGMVFQKSGIWYLRGLVSVAVSNEQRNGCNPNHYTVFTDLAKFLPWIKQNINSF